MTNYAVLKQASPTQMALVFQELRVNTFKEAYAPFGVEFNPSQEKLDRELAEITAFLMSEYVPSEEE